MGSISSYPNHIQRPAPCLGEHNDYVYRELMGLSVQRYRELEELGQIGDDYLTG